MISDHQFILDCQNKVFIKQPLVAHDAEKLLNVSKSELKTLSNCANKITRKFQGDRIDVEQLSNIKKN
jgi:biotin synthase